MAADGDKVIGSSMGIVCIALDAPFLVVENVIVSGECRGQGVGRKIFEALDEFALKNQCEYALLVSSGFRKGAHRFYEAVGYTEAERVLRLYYKKNNKISNNLTIYKSFPIYSLGKRVYILEKVLHDVRKK